MKTLHWLIMGILCLVLPACSSNDEPDAPYTGPWEVYYGETFWGIHNNCKDFNEWLANHKDCLVAAKFDYPNGNSVEYTEYVTEEDYKEFYSGEIEWCEMVDKASEEEIKSMVDKFTSFTIENSKNRIYDRFYASYKRYDGK